MKVLILKDCFDNGVRWKAGETLGPDQPGRYHLEAHEPQPFYSVDLDLIGAPLDAEGQALVDELTAVLGSQTQEPSRPHKSPEIIRAIAAGAGSIEDRRKRANAYMNAAQ